MSWDLDFSGTTLEQADTGGKLPPGHYRAKLVATSEDPEKGEQHFNFRVLHGPLTGAEMVLKLPNPRFADNMDKAKSTMARARMYAVRLGLVSKGDEGKTASIDWQKAVGKEMVIHVENRSFTNDRGETINFTQIAYNGIFPLDHHSLTNKIRAEVGLPLDPNETAKAGSSGAGGGGGNGASGGAAAPGGQASQQPTPNVDVSHLWGSSKAG